MHTARSDAAPYNEDEPLRAIAAGHPMAGHRRLQRGFILWLPWLSFLVVAGSLLMAAAIGLLTYSTDQARTPVYTVGQVRDLLLHDPSAVVDHTIDVHGMLQGPFVFCGRVNPCPPATLGLVDDGNGILGSDQYLPVQPVAFDALSLPRFTVPTTLHLRIEPAPSACALNPSILCYVASLVETPRQ